MNATTPPDREPQHDNRASSSRRRTTTGPDWSVAVFSARESSAVLVKAIAAALNARTSRSIVVDVIVNGNKTLAEEIQRLKSELVSTHDAAADLRIWYIALGDKANAWNQYVYHIWPQSELAFFVDGYVEVLPDAFSAIERGIATSEQYLAATGVPQVGHSATRLRRQMLREGGIHGNLFALSRIGMQKVVESGFKLPLNIYRTDPTLGAALAFNLDPVEYDFDLRRIRVEPNASWSYAPLSGFKGSHLLTQFKRFVRQAQGQLENRAIRNHFAVQKKSPASLPTTTRDLIEAWLKTATTREKMIFVKSPLTLYALHKLRRQNRTTTPGIEPELLGTTCA